MSPPLVPLRRRPKISASRTGNKPRIPQIGTLLQQNHFLAELPTSIPAPTLAASPRVPSRVQSAEWSCPWFPLPALCPAPRTTTSTSCWASEHTATHPAAHTTRYLRVLPARSHRRLAPLTLASLRPMPSGLPLLAARKR